MPVTIRPAAHGADPVQLSRWSHSDVQSSEALLLRTITDDHGSQHVRIKGLIQTSFSRNLADFEAQGRIFASKNGFVNACIDAYNDHHHLIIRPEDVWFAILTQLSIYVNHKAEALRRQFVSQSGQEKLYLEVANPNKVDHGEMAVMMTKLMNERLRNRETREWIMPNFTTTDKVDQVVAATIFMGTMQKYFIYSWGTRCGIPSVTLEGEIRDWVDLHGRVMRMADIFGSGVAGFRDAVLPAVEGMARGFLDAEGLGRKFWQGICVRHNPNGSGTPTYTGWITAFTYWAEDGRSMHSPTSTNMKGRTMHLRRGDIPAGFVTTPVTLKNLMGQAEIQTEMCAGSLAIRVTGDNGSLDRNGLNTLAPQTGWFVYKV